MTEELIKTFFREIRQNYYSAINDWALADRKQMIFNLKEAKRKTEDFLKLLEGENGSQFRKKRIL